MIQTLSSSAFGHDTQVQDVVSFLKHNAPASYTALIQEFPEWETLVWDSRMSSLDTEKNGVDPDYTSTVADWIEANTEVYWEDGEPYFDFGGEAESDFMPGLSAEVTTQVPEPSNEDDTED